MKTARKLKAMKKQPVKRRQREVRRHAVTIQYVGQINPDFDRVVGQTRDCSGTYLSNPPVSDMTWEFAGLIGANQAFSFLLQEIQRLRALQRIEDDWRIHLKLLCDTGAVKIQTLAELRYGKFELPGETYRVKCNAVSQRRKKA